MLCYHANGQWCKGKHTSSEEYLWGSNPHGQSAFQECTLAVRVPMARNPSKLYSHHVANLRELELAISHTARLARRTISSCDPQQSLRSLLRLYAFLVGAWAECRLQKLLYEEFGLNDDERSVVLAKPAQLDQWKETVDYAFRKHHGIKKAPLSKRILGVEHAARRAALHDVLDNELRIVIEIRNKLAHGQWVYPLNNDGSAVEPEKYKQINKENLQSLQLKFALIGHLADATHDLVVSPKTFVRDFERHFQKLFQARTNLITKDYAKYEQSLVESRRSARVAKKIIEKPAQ